MLTEIYTFYADNFEEVRKITQHLNKLPKETLKSLEAISSTTSLGIDTPVSVPNLIRIYPLNGNLEKFEGPIGSTNGTNSTRFTNKGMKYSVFKQTPPWIEKS